MGAPDGRTRCLLTQILKVKPRDPATSGFFVAAVQNLLVSELVGEEVERPAIARELRDAHRARFQGPFVSASPTHRKPFLTESRNSRLWFMTKRSYRSSTWGAPVRKAS